MATNVTMPKLGLTMETGKILEWKAIEDYFLNGLTRVCLCDSFS